MDDSFIRANLQFIHATVLVNESKGENNTLLINNNPRSQTQIYYACFGEHEIYPHKHSAVDSTDGRVSITNCCDMC